MKRIDYLFVVIGVFYAAFGMIFGIWLGATDNLQFANTHAHINLVGFVSFVLFGIVYRLWPALKERRLALAHFWVANIGTPVFLYGKSLVDRGTDPNMPVMLGSAIVVLSMLLFAANLLCGVEAAAGVATPAE